MVSCYCQHSPCARGIPLWLSHLRARSELGALLAVIFLRIRYHARLAGRQQTHCSLSPVRLRFIVTIRPTVTLESLPVSGFVPELDQRVPWIPPPRPSERQGVAGDALVSPRSLPVAPAEQSSSTGPFIEAIPGAAESWLGCGPAQMGPAPRQGRG